MTTARTAAEEQVHGLGANPARRRTWRLGCNTDETAYHVVSSCITQEYTARHDCIVHHLIRSILVGTHAPEHVHAQLRPDVVIIATNPDVVYVFEVDVSHLQNIELQEKIEEVRYGKNSIQHITERTSTPYPRILTSPKSWAGCLRHRAVIYYRYLCLLRFIKI
uniref:Uncharacterized protein n=1 Tax=Trichogramma kaykai TaxID=54128 RepID=A0ABD2VX64_9HYME